MGMSTSPERSQGYMLSKFGHLSNLFIYIDDLIKEAIANPEEVFKILGDNRDVAVTTLQNKISL